MIILNQRQQMFVDMAVDWFYHSSSSLLQLAGYAGTGKSVVISKILEKLNLSKDEVLPMAYTGQACTIMRKRGLSNACTCHSGLFTPIQEVDTDPETGSIKMNKTFNVPITKWKFIPKDFSFSKVKLIILDEAWMIPKKFRKFIDATGIKVIAAGDPGQLPPIGDDPGYLVDEPIFFLTELMRQSENSPIVYLADRARKGLPIDTGVYGDSSVVYEDEVSIDAFLNTNIVLCGKNATRDNINTKIRKDIKNIKVDYPMFGERLICRKNNWNKVVNGIPLVNGLTGTVVTPPEIGKFDGDVFYLDFLPDLLDTPFTNIDVNYKYLNSSYAEKEQLKTNPYLRGERFEYAYASTVHLAQGSEYSSGIYFEEFLNKNIQCVLNYTAITRFYDKLIYVKQKRKFWNI